MNSKAGIGTQAFLIPEPMLFKLDSTISFSAQTLISTIILRKGSLENGLLEIKRDKDNVGKSRIRPGLAKSLCLVRVDRWSSPRVSVAPGQSRRPRVAEAASSGDCRNPRWL